MAIFYVSGFLFEVAAVFLFVLALRGFPLRSSPAWLIRSVSPLAFILAGTSAVLLSAYGAELLIALGSSNRFEWFTFLAARFDHWFYWFEILAALLPQLFWFRRMRRLPSAILCISLGSLLPRVFEYVVIAITEVSRPG